MGAREVQGALRPRGSFSLQPRGLCHQPTPSLAHLLPHYPILPQGPSPAVCMLAPPASLSQSAWPQDPEVAPEHPSVLDSGFHPLTRSSPQHAPTPRVGSRPPQAPQPDGGPGEGGMGSELGRAAFWAFSRQRQLRRSVQAWLCRNAIPEMPHVGRASSSQQSTVTDTPRHSAPTAQRRKLRLGDVKWPAQVRQLLSGRIWTRTQACLIPHFTLDQGLSHSSLPSGPGDGLVMLPSKAVVPAYFCPSAQSTLRAAPPCASFSDPSPGGEGPCLFSPCSQPLLFL